MIGPVAIGTDHAGFELKAELVEYLHGHGVPLVDVGAYALDPGDDYPDYAFKVADIVREGRARRGIIVCGSGVGACIAANKVQGVRASVCHDLYSAAQGVEHDDMNVLCLGGKIVRAPLGRELAHAFLSATFDGGERFRRRLDKVLQREARERSGE